MDEENEGHNLGAYENMERSDIRPDFLDPLNEERNAENGDNPPQGSRLSSGFVKNMLRDKEKKAAGDAAAKVTSKVGGTKGKAIAKGIDIIEKNGGGLGGGLSSLSGKGKGKSKFKINGKKAIPLVILLLILIVIWAVASFVGQWLFPIGFKSRSVEDWNSTKTSNTVRTDALTDQQLAGKSDSSDDPEATVFDNMGFSEDQIESVKQMGLGYEVSDDGKTVALTYTSSDGKKNLVTSNGTLSRYTGSDEVADSGDAISDSGPEGVSEEEAKANVVAALGADEDTRVLSFSQAMAEPQFKDLYTRATKYWRGDTSGWFTDTTETVVERLGISRNNYKDFTLSGDNGKNTEAFLAIAKDKNTASEGSDIGDQSLSERVETVANASNGPSCGASSAFNDIESLIATDQTARQVSAGSLWLEAIDKTMAGEGNSAPLTAISNIVVESGGATTEGMAHLFGNDVLEQSNNMVQKVSAQAHGNNENILNAENIESEKYRGCVYTGDYNQYHGDGVLVEVGSLFKRIGDWITNKAKAFIETLKSFIFRDSSGIGTDSSKSATSSYVGIALSSTVDAYNEMKEQTYFNGNDTALLGEALVSSSERIMNEKAKSAGQVVGDETNLLANYRAQQEVIAEEAEYDRRNKSPFDVTSQHTFLGSIVYNLIPFAVSTKSTVLTSTVSNVGSLISNSLTKLLPTSDAISEAKVERGDCVLSNNIGAVSNPHCNNYYDSDLELAAGNAQNLYKTVLGMRPGKYTYRSHYNIKKNGKMTTEPYPSSLPDYGSGPINSAEGISCVTDWGVDGSPIEWSYTIHPNFQYEGYKTGWKNRTSASTSDSQEHPKNDIDPTQCELDLAKDENKQPIINQDGPLGLFILTSGQRGSEWGVADDSNIKLVAKSDFTHGRVHPCLVWDKVPSTAPYYGYYPCDKDPYSTLGWTGSSKDELEKNTAKSKFMSRWIGGAAYVAYNGSAAGGSFGDMNTGFGDNDERFKDPTRFDDYFWNEMKYYQAYAELLEWMETVGLVKSSGVAKTAQAYYDENPLDNTYEGKIARLSGMSKERVVAVLDLFQYVAWLKNYDAAALYPTPRPLPEKIENNSNEEIMGQAEKITTLAGVVYDEMRYRTVTV